MSFKMQNFSSKHKLQRFDPPVYEIACFKIDHLISKYVSKVPFCLSLFYGVTFLKCSRCHTNVVFSVVRVVRCDCGFVNNVASHTLFR
jgi:hypothetical protein